METLIKGIEKNINKSVDAYIEQIYEKWEIDKEELKKMWESMENTTLPSRRSSVSGSNTCPHIFKRGEKKGQVCGKNCRGEYCGTHKSSHTKSENTEYKKIYKWL